MTDGDGDGGHARNKAVVAELYERGFTGGDESAFAELYAPDFVHHSKVLHDVPPGGEGERLSMLAFRRAMPDARFEVLQLLAEDDFVMARLRATGTPVHDFGHNVRAGERFDVHAVALFRLASGRLAEEWFFVDGGA